MNSIDTVEYVKNEYRKLKEREHKEGLTNTAKMDLLALEKFAKSKGINLENIPIMSTVYKGLY